MSLTIVCPACGTLNRVPEEKLSSRPRCGACKASLFGGEPVAADETKMARHVAHDGVPVLVDIWANWCGPCRTMAPQFAAAAHRLEPHARLLKLDADTAPETMGRYGISSIPSLLLFKNGKLLARQAGALSAAQIVQWVHQHEPLHPG